MILQAIILGVLLYGFSGLVDCSWDAIIEICSKYYNYILHVVPGVSLAISGYSFSGRIFDLIEVVSFLL